MVVDQLPAEWLAIDTVGGQAELGLDSSGMQEETVAAEMEWPAPVSPWQGSLDIPSMDVPSSDIPTMNVPTMDYTTTTHTAPFNAFAYSGIADIDFTGVVPSWYTTTTATTTTTTTADDENTAVDDEPIVERKKNENWSRYTRRAEKRQLPSVTYLAVRPPTKAPRPFMALQPHWPRGGDTDTWMFCAGELLSFVQDFARNGSTHFILPLPYIESFDGGLVLHRAMGVCAARETLGEEGREVFEAMLDAEVAQLVDSSMLSAPMLVGAGGDDGIRGLAAGFRMELSRLQAMVLYLTIRFFGPTQHQRRLGEELEPLLASWTREILAKLRMLEMHSQQRNSFTSRASNGRTTPDGPSSETSVSNTRVTHSGALNYHYQQQQRQQKAHAIECLTDEEIQSAYRTILISYIVRGVYGALVYKICHVLAEMATIPVLVSEPLSLDRDALIAHRTCLGVPAELQQDGGTSSSSSSPPPGLHRMSYAQLAEAWNTHLMAPITKYDPFTKLLMVACKGIGILSPVS